MPIDPWTAPLHHAVVLLLALFIDRFVGEPPVRLHPVVWMGAGIGWARDRAPQGSTARFLYGLAMAIGLPAASAVVLVLPSSVPWLGPVYAIWLVTSCFAARGLVDAGRRLADHVDADNIEEARSSLRWLCSRDPAALDGTALTAAATESVVENASDSVIAPMIWYALAGLPGLVAYRCINTLDAMVGYRGKYEWLGKASARLDDLVNLVPARLTALGLLVVGAVVHGCDPVRAARVLAGDRRQTSSPNAGWPIAATAGLLGVELSKVGHYTIGRGLEPSSARTLRLACTLSDWTMTGAVLGLVAALAGAAVAM